MSSHFSHLVFDHFTVVLISCARIIKYIHVVAALEVPEFLPSDQTRHVDHLSFRCHLTGVLVTACGDDAVRVFKEDATSVPDQPVFSLVAQVTKAHSQDVNCVTWNPKEAGLLATCSDDGEIAIWQFQQED